MFLFIPVMVLLLLLALGLMFHVVFGSPSRTRIDHERMNVELSREQMAQLKELRRQKQMNDDEYLEARTEIETNLAMNLQGSSAGTQTDAHSTPKSVSWRERSIALLLAPAVAALAIFLYLELGETRALDTEFVTAMSAASNSQSSRQMQGQEQEKLPSIKELLPQLEAHLESSPEDAQGWSLLGTTYLRMQRYKDADKALSKAAQLLPGNADVLLQLADAKAMSNHGVLSGEPLQLVDRALKIVPNDARALWLKGMASEQSGDLALAVEHWQKLLPQLQGEPESLARMQSMIADAQGKIAAGSAPAPDINESTEEGAAASDEGTNQPSDFAGLQITVTLEKSMRAKLNENTAVFVYAKASEGPPMPLAVVRKNVADLPLQVRLDDSMAMMPQLKLSAFETVTVGARISMSGNPVAQPGDLFTEVFGVNHQADAVVQVHINRIVE